MRAVRTWLALPVVLLAAIVGACAGPPAATSSIAPIADAGKPQVVIQSPPANAQVVIGIGVDVITTGVDPIGVARIDLKVNGSTVSSAEAPLGGLTSFSATHLWLPAEPGPATLLAVAYRTDGVPSDPYEIAVTVLPEGSTAAPYATYGGPLPSNRASTVPGNYVAPTYKPNPTYRANPTYAANPTYTAGATHVANPTGTAPPTYTTAPTYSTSPTYTAEPSTLVAPPDGNYFLVIPFNGNPAEVSDYVSYPAGDVEDRVSYDISGMSATPPGNLAHVIIQATCEGVGQQYITFQVGTAKFGCGEKIIDKTVTNDSRTGSVRVFAFAGAYVHWTLVGTAFTP